MKALLNWRYYVLMSVGIIAIIGTFSAPVDAQPYDAWLFILLISKIIGFSSWYFFYRLTAYWERLNLIPEMSKIIQ